MKALIKKFAKQLFPRQIRAIRTIQSDRFHRRGNLSYGQEGEDRVIASLLFKAYGGRHPDKGFFVDVGAHDPFRFSNTYLFYKQGWSGINIDAAPGSMRSFSVHRPRDLNLEVGIGSERTSATFYILNEPALNTFDRELAVARSIPPWKVISEAEVAIVPLRDVFAEHLQNNQTIDFLTIDVEGRDMAVLQSNDWQKYRPKLVVVEIFGTAIADAAADPVAAYLANQKYIFYAKTVNTTLFVDSTIAAFASHRL